MSNPKLREMFAELARGKGARQPEPPQPVKISMAEFADKINEIESMEDFAGRQQARNSLAEAIKYGLVVLDRRAPTPGPRAGFRRLDISPKHAAALTAESMRN
jgi:hypothetical protein